MRWKSAWRKPSPTRVTLIEWADRLGRWLPHRRLSVAFVEEDQDGSRRIVLDGDSDWHERLEGLTAHAAT